MFNKKIYLTIILLVIASCNRVEKQQVVTNETRAQERNLEEKEQNTVYFDFDSAKLTLTTQEFIDNVLLPDLKNNPQAKAQINGYCDERGSFAYNKKLGKKRANAVKARFVKNGISAARIKTFSYGELNPQDLGHNEEAWAKNRRVVVSIKK